MNLFYIHFTKEYLVVYLVTRIVSGPLRHEQLRVVNSSRDITELFTVTFLYVNSYLFLVVNEFWYCS